MELKVIGVGTTEEEIRALVQEGKEWIAHYSGQQTISFPDEEAEQLKREEDAMIKSGKWFYLNVNTGF